MMASPVGHCNLIYGVLTASTNKAIMEGGSLLLLTSHSSFPLRSSSSPLYFVLRLSSSSSFPPPLVGIRFLTPSSNFSAKNTVIASCCRVFIPPSAFLKENDTVSTSSRDFLPKIDKSGRFCSPRAARELALSIIYAACLEGSDPVRVFEKRVNARRELGYDFDKESLTAYNHMSFGGPPVIVETQEEADSLLLKDMKETEIEAEVLAAPPKLVYSKLILRFTRKLLVAVGDRWDTHVLTIDKIAPPNWKSKPAGRILEFCILHLAMAEIAVLGTRHQIVINEAVDLSKRFCDGAAPRIINGCLKTFVKDVNEHDLSRGLEDKFKLAG